MKKARKGKEDEKAEAAAKGRSVAFWCQEIADSRKREVKFRKLAKKAVSIYETEESEKMPFNILYSNTETLKAALYNSTPKPTASRRFKDADPIGKIASQFITRYLEFFIDSGDRDYSDFDELILSSIAEGLLPGRGLTRFKYEAEMSEAMEGQPATVTYETVCGEEVSWDRVYFGYTKSWAKLPWLAFEHFMGKEELEKNFGAEIAAKIPLAVSDVTSKGGSSDDEDSSPPKDIGEATLAHIYEIWDKDEKQVSFICPDYKDAVLKQVADPLELSGFFPIPRPIVFGKKISSLVPVPLYAYYEEQDKELNRITIRINKIIRALKVRGFYDSSLEGMADVLTADDNVLLPAANVASMQQGQTLEKAIWLMPIEKLINVLQQLYMQRQQVKAIIYEITAIADIMRGASQASETLGAQEIKAQWGSLRLKSMQKEVSRYVRDCLRIVAEIGFKQLSPETLMQATNLTYPTREQKAQAQAMAAQAQQQAAMLPPEARGQVAIPPQVQQVLTFPAIEDLMAVLQDNMQRRYKVDIETDSTIALESANEKKDIGEALNAISQFLNGALPMVQGKILPFGAMKAILLGIVRRFKFGTEVEGEIEKMVEPPAPPPEEKKAGPDPRVEAEKAAIELQTLKAETALKAKKAQRDEELAVIETQLKLKDLQRQDQLADAKFRSQLYQLQVKVKTAEVKAAETALGDQNAPV